MRDNHNQMNILAGNVLTWAFIVLSAGFIGVCLYALSVVMLSLGG